VLDALTVEGTNYFLKRLKVDQGIQQPLKAGVRVINLM